MKAQSPTNHKKMSILVYVGLDRLGDGLLKLPFVRGLRQAWPDAHITWLAGKEDSVYGGVLRSLVTNYIDEVIDFGGIGVHPSELLRPVAGGKFRGRTFDLIIDSQKIVWSSLSLMRIRHNRFISPAARFLLSSTKPEKGYRFPKSMQRQLLDLLELCSGQRFPTPTRLNLDIPPQMIADAETIWSPNGPSVALAPGAGGLPKCWPLQRFIDVAQGLCNQGVSVAFILGPQELHWLEHLAAACPQASFPLQNDYIVKKYGFSPFFTMALAGRFDKGLANDAGVAHLLAIGGLALVILYGPTVPEKFRPMGKKIKIIEARDYGAREMSAIPFGRVYDALLSETGTGSE